jgi:hypothetical protein
MLLIAYFVIAMIHSNYMASKLHWLTYYIVFKMASSKCNMEAKQLEKLDFNKQVSIQHFFIALPYLGPHLSSYISRYFCVTSCSRYKFCMMMFTGKSNVLLSTVQSTIHAVQFSPATLRKYVEHKREVLTFNR